LVQEEEKKERRKKVREREYEGRKMVGKRREIRGLQRTKDNNNKKKIKKGKS